MPTISLGGWPASPQIPPGNSQLLPQLRRRELRFPQLLEQRRWPGRNRSAGGDGEFDQGYDCLNGPPNNGFDNTYMNWADQNGVSYLAWGWWELNPGSPTPGCSSYSADGNSTYALIDGSGNALAPDGTALQTHLAALSGSVSAPGLIGISPTSGPEAGGTTVVITGTNFTGVSNVSFGSTSAATFTVNSATEITATSPVGTGTVDVTVTTSAGVTATSAADQFTYIGASCDPPSFTSTGSATAAAGVPFTFTVTTCSTSTPVIKASHLPAGLRLVSNDNGTATILGTPAAHDSGAYAANITATVRGQPAASQSVVITVDNAPVFKSRALYTAHDGVSFTYPITTQYAYPAPTITTTSTLPAGITLTDNANGTATLGGTPGPNAGGVYRITITGANGIGVPVNQSFVLIVYQSPVIARIDTTTITRGVAMTPLPITVAGYPEPKVRVSGLPGDQAGLWVHRGNNLGGIGRLHREDHRIEHGWIDDPDHHPHRQPIGKQRAPTRHSPGVLGQVCRSERHELMRRFWPARMA